MSVTECDAIPSLKEFNSNVLKDHIPPIKTIKNGLNHLFLSKERIFQHFEKAPVNDKIINALRNQIRYEYDTFWCQYNNLKFAMELFEYQLSVHQKLHRFLISDELRDIPTFLRELDEQMIINQDDLKKIDDYIHLAQPPRPPLSPIKERNEDLADYIHLAQPPKPPLSPIKERNEDLANLTDHEIMYNNDTDEEDENNKDDEDETDSWTMGDLDLITDEENMSPMTKSIGQSMM